MIRIADHEFETNATYEVNTADATVSVKLVGSYTDDDLNELKNAKLLEAITSVGGEDMVVGSYVLVAWKSVEKTHDGYRLVWQTYQTTELDKLKQENEDLTQAVLELAAIVGGGNG